MSTSLRLPFFESRAADGRGHYDHHTGLQWGRPREGGVGSYTEYDNEYRFQALQWGRPREGGVGWRDSTPLAHAATLQWGRPREGGVGACSVKMLWRRGRFNGAAPERAESVVYLRRVERVEGLQWGRPRESGVGFRR